jgi:uncharacterized membrane protein YdbT with pleckstrin-like domain
VNELDRNLLTGEEIVFQTRKHWFAPIRDSALAVLLLVGSFLVRWLSPDGDGLLGTFGDLADFVANVALIAAIAWIGWNILAYLSANFGVSNMRVLRYEGIIQRRSSETLLSAVSDIRLLEPGLGRMLGYGDLHVFTQAGDSGKDEFSTIKQAAAMRTTILELKTRAEARPFAAPAPAAAPVGPAPANPADAAAATLARLTEMRDQGLITPEEFDAKRAEIISRI